MRADKSAKQNSKGSSLGRLTWVSLALTLSTEASAFQSSSELRSTATQLAKASINGYIAEHPSRFGPPNAVSGKGRGSLVSTRLRYRDGDMEDSLTPRSWWKNIFDTPKQDVADQQQENVDEYLEFLDRRYRRIHSNEKKSESSKTFSALNWIAQGSPSRNDVRTTQQQEEDALYVLGVAGLASERLLQKHHLVLQEGRGSTQQRHASRPKSMDIVDVEIANDGASAMLIKKILVPLIRVLYTTQRRKDLFVGKQVSKVRSLCSSVIRNTARSLARGPAATVNSIIEVGGGKKNIALTLMMVTSFFLVFRPIFQAAIAEATVSP